jgi:hypothetical protein
MRQWDPTRVNSEFIKNEPEIARVAKEKMAEARPNLGNLAKAGSAHSDAAFGHLSTF